MPVMQKVQRFPFSCRMQVPEGNAKNAGAPITAATSIPAACGRDIPRELSTEEVYELVKGYGEAARRAMEAGVDAVEIHMAHGYLVSTFMVPTHQQACGMNSADALKTGCVSPD